MEPLTALDSAGRGWLAQAPINAKEMGNKTPLDSMFQRGYGRFIFFSEFLGLDVPCMRTRMLHRNERMVFQPLKHLQQQGLRGKSMPILTNH